MLNLYKISLFFQMAVALSCLQAASSFCGFSSEHAEKAGGVGRPRQSSPRPPCTQNQAWD